MNPHIARLTRGMSRASEPTTATAETRLNHASR